ncbi:hypothetical protein BBJ28_00026696, partial [Nothophytophthora sp. Chile5]
DATVLILLPPSTASPQRDRAQRTLLLNDADRVLVLANGEVATLVTPAELVAQGLNEAKIDTGNEHVLPDVTDSEEDASEDVLPEAEEEATDVAVEEREEQASDASEPGNSDEPSVATVPATEMGAEAAVEGQTHSIEEK